MEERKMINRSNYEVYFIDYHDGNLDDSQKKELFAFLSDNPDLKTEFQRFSNIILREEKVFFDKEKLKKNTITLYNYKTYFIAWFENDLNSEEKIEVKKFLEVHPGLQKEFELFRQTKVQPDNTIRVENKDSLKKGGKVIAFNAWIYRSAAIAACIAVAFLFFWFNKSESGKTSVIANVPVVKQQETPAQEKELASSPNKNFVESVPVKAEKIRKSSVQRQPQQLAVVQPKEELKKPSVDTAQNMNPKQSVTAPSSSIVINELPAGDSIKKSFNVFTDDDLVELGLKEKQKEQSHLNKTAANLGKKLFGENAKLENRTNEQDLSRTFALAVGTFEFSRTTTR